MDVDRLIESIVERACLTPGAQAIVLGGSRARGTHQPTSDVDLCFYYEPESPLDLNQLSRLAAGLDDTHRADILTPIGGWGPWINGGGWLTVGGQPVDFLYRDLSQVRAVIADCRAGQVQVAYQPGHPHAFVSSIYMAEVALCRPLWDPAGTLAGLKSDTEPYPIELQQALIRRFAWEIEFALGNGQKSAARGDVTYAAGCCFRSAACLLQTLFALNRQYWLNEKGALALAATFPLCPPRLQQRVAAAFAVLAADEAAITQALAELAGVAHDVMLLLD